jgi:hypothetical protein
MEMGNFMKILAENAHLQEVNVAEVAEIIMTAKLATEQAK